MNEVALGALFTAGGGVLIALVQVLGARLTAQIPTTERRLDEVDVVRAGIRRHIPHCTTSADLFDLL